MDRERATSVRTITRVPDGHSGVLEYWWRGPEPAPEPARASSIADDVHPLLSLCGLQLEQLELDTPNSAVRYGRTHSGLASQALIRLTVTSPARTMAGAARAIENFDRLYKEILSTREQDALGAFGTTAPQALFDGLYD